MVVVALLLTMMIMMATRLMTHDRRKGTEGLGKCWGHQISNSLSTTGFSSDHWDAVVELKPDMFQFGPFGCHCQDETKLSSDKLLFVTI